MTPIARTFTFVGVAAVSVLLASAAWYGSQPSPVAGYGDTGQLFFPDFDDVSSATALSVVDYDAEEKDVVNFSVRQNDDGLWVIPSHHDYPAEAEDRLAKTATSLLGVKKTAVQSRSEEDWKRYGVVDPAADGAATAEERGTRLTLNDGSGNALVDLIIGNQVEGRSSHYFVREPEKKTTFVSEINIDLSAKFSDWIEPDLLKISANDIVKVTLDNYSINEERGTVEKKEFLEFTKADLKTTGDWQLAGLDGDTEELDNSPITAIATNLDQLKIVGVRPKPEGLGDDMRINPALKQILQMQMQAQGYFIGGDKDGKERLYSNEGELIAGINSAVEYTLYFGEIARGTGKEIEVGLSSGEKSETDAETVKDEADDKKEGQDSAAENTEEDGPRRYLLVTAKFNEALLGEKPVAPVEPVKPDILKAAESAKPVEEDAKSDEAADDAKKDAPAIEAKEETTDKAPEDDACDPQEDSAKTQDEEKSEPAAEETPTPEPAVATPDETAPPAAADVEKKVETGAEPAKDAPAKDAPAKPETPAADPVKEEAPVAPPKDPKQIAQEQYDQAMGAYEAEKSAYETRLKEHEDKVKAGQEKAKELSRRFAGWYYVISSESFEKFRVARKDVVSKKEVKEEEPKDAATEPEATEATDGK